jgi:hypothetical protein
MVVTPTLVDSNGAKAGRTGLVDSVYGGYEIQILTSETIT